MSIDPELRDLAARVAARAGGAGVLREAQLECAATILGVHPRVIERARALLGEPGGGEAFERAVAAACGRTPLRPGPPPAPPPPRTAAGLRGAVERRCGAEFLLRAPAETVAVLFGVDAFLVEEARALAAGEAAGGGPGAASGPASGGGPVGGGGAVGGRGPAAGGGAAGPGCGPGAT